MSSDVFIKAQNLTKSFGLFDSAGARAVSLLLRRPPREVLHAVSGFNLEARPGDFIGIIGRNGAGKSTLLEMIAGTREPTSGSLEVSGRVAALLELGAGFNPAFSGRENAQLCAAAYGLSDREIADRLPAIAGFADMEAFMDRPVREYSAGMFARLAFSVCIHVDADILIIDEILGVGDARFQQRSMRFLRDFARERIVLFVSHNETAVAALCNRAFFLWQGRCLAEGAPKTVLHAYHKLIASLSGEGSFAEAGSVSGPDTPEEPIAGQKTSSASEQAPPASGVGTLLSVAMTADGKPAATLAGGERVEILFRFESPGREPWAGFVVRNQFGEAIFGRDSHGAGNPTSGKTECIFAFAMPFLPTGTYALDAVLSAPGPDGSVVLDRREVALSFQMVSRHLSPGLANIAMRQARIIVPQREAA